MLTVMAAYRHNNAGTHMHNRKQCHENGLLPSFRCVPAHNFIE